MRKFFPFLLLTLFFSCQNESSIQSVPYLKIAGETMGTTYHLTYQDSLERNFKKEVDSILVEINESVSTYIPDSEISRFNQNKAGNPYDYIFKDVFLASEKIFKKTEGYFDPTVMPLVNYWGFGYKDKNPTNRVDSLKIDTIRQYVGFKKINKKCDEISFGMVCSYKKLRSEIELDFSAIAKGYAVDIISEYFEENNINNYLVEIGGELRTKGKNPRGQLWTTAINTPKINARLNQYQAIVKMDNKAIATSGNYRNFYQVGDDWYGHTINPKTGFPEKSNLLSVSVLADDCMSADGYATAMMSMGLEKAKALVEKLEYLDAFFIFADETGELETFYTQGFEGKVVL
ncbi:MAG: FAD:protein FMN transferase [Bacteroidota bacterium]